MSRTMLFGHLVAALICSMIHAFLSGGIRATIPAQSVEEGPPNRLAYIYVHGYYNTFSYMTLSL